MDEQFIEFSFSVETDTFVATDEVGRGCLAGPVTVASIKISPASVANLQALKKIGVGDSKKISDKKRKKIIETLGFDVQTLKTGGVFEVKNDLVHIQVSISHIPVEKIDEVNILQATFLGMIASAEPLLSVSDLWLIDGDKAPKAATHAFIETIIKGDSKSVLIGLASIVAKEARDLLMCELHDKFPWYDWNNNAGYGTSKHLKGIKDKGFSEHHRKSFSVDLSKVE